MAIFSRKKYDSPVDPGGFPWVFPWQFFSKSLVHREKTCGAAWPCVAWKKQISRGRYNPWLANLVLTNRYN